MKWACTSILVAVTLFVVIDATAGGASKVNYAIINFEPANLERCLPNDFKIWIELEASNKKKYATSFKIEGQADMGAVLCDEYANYLKIEDWKFVRKGDRLLITTITDDKQHTSQIVKVSIKMENFPTKMMPRVIASPTVKVEIKKK